jgi:hypothetical protein
MRLSGGQAPSDAVTEPAFCASRTGQVCSTVLIRRRTTCFQYHPEENPVNVTAPSFNTRLLVFQRTCHPCRTDRGPDRKSHRAAACVWRCARWDSQAEVGSNAGASSGRQCQRSSCCNARVTRSCTLGSSQTACNWLVTVWAVRGPNMSSTTWRSAHPRQDEFPGSG